jgi:phosphoribosylformylglycinamidine cyclo-ligase
MSITYQQSGVNYGSLDPIKQIAQRAAKKTSGALKRTGAEEIPASRGESAYVWRQGKHLFASVMEGLGTKNLVADAMYEKTGKSYYDIVAHDTVACIINDLATVGATPSTLHAYWATGSSDWFADKKRARDLIRGWKKACEIAGVSWGGGETPGRGPLTAVRCRTVAAPGDQVAAWLAWTEPILKITGLSE